MTTPYDEGRREFLKLLGRVGSSYALIQLSPLFRFLEDANRFSEYESDLRKLKVNNLPVTTRNSRVNEYLGNVNAIERAWRPWNVDTTVPFPIWRHHPFVKSHQKLDLRFVYFDKDVNPGIRDQIDLLADEVKQRLQSLMIGLPINTSFEIIHTPKDIPWQLFYTPSELITRFDIPETAHLEDLSYVYLIEDGLIARGGFMSQTVYAGVASNDRFNNVRRLALHELGHTLGVPHCREIDCIMSVRVKEILLQSELSLPENFGKRCRLVIKTLLKGTYSHADGKDVYHFRGGNTPRQVAKRDFLEHLRLVLSEYLDIEDIRSLQFEATLGGVDEEDLAIFNKFYGRRKRLLEVKVYNGITHATSGDSTIL